MSFLGQNNFFLQRKSQSKAEEEKEEGGAVKGEETEAGERSLWVGVPGLPRELGQAPVISLVGTLPRDAHGGEQP